MDVTTVKNFLSVFQARELVSKYSPPVESLESVLGSAFDEIKTAASEGKNAINLTNKSFPYEVKKVLKELGFSVSIFTEQEEFIRAIRRIEVSW